MLAATMFAGGVIESSLSDSDGIVLIRFSGCNADRPWLTSCCALGLRYVEWSGGDEAFTFSRRRLGSSARSFADDGAEGRALGRSAGLLACFLDRTLRGGGETLSLSNLRLFAGDDLDWEACLGAAFSASALDFTGGAFWVLAVDVRDFAGIETTGTSLRYWLEGVKVNIASRTILH